jgi:hypothetical protein
MWDVDACLTAVIDGLIVALECSHVAYVAEKKAGLETE